MRGASLARWCLVLAALAFAGPAVSHADNQFAAIAFNKRTGAVGYSNAYDSRSGAEARALMECGRGCQIIVWVRNSCAALAVGSRLGYGWGMDADRDSAKDIAMQNCRVRTNSCTIRAWTCSG